MRYTGDRIPTYPALLRGAHGELPAILPSDQTHVTLHALIVAAEKRRHDLGETNDRLTLDVDGDGKDAMDAGDDDRRAVYTRPSDDNAHGGRYSRPTSSSHSAHRGRVDTQQSPIGVLGIMTEDHVNGVTRQSVDGAIRPFNQQHRRMVD